MLKKHNLLVLYSVAQENRYHLIPIG